MPFPSLGDLPNPGIEPQSPARAGGFFTSESLGKPNSAVMNMLYTHTHTHTHTHRSGHSHPRQEFHDLPLSLQSTLERLPHQLRVSYPIRILQQTLCIVRVEGICRVNLLRGS